MEGQEMRRRKHAGGGGGGGVEPRSQARQGTTLAQVVHQSQKRDVTDIGDKNYKWIHLRGSRNRTVHSSAPGLRSWPRIFLSLMLTYSSSITFLPGGSMGTPLDSLSRSERRSTNTTLPSLLTRSRAEAGVRSPRYPRRLPKNPRTRGGTCTSSRGGYASSARCHTANR